MTPYEVDWQPNALNRLADIWMQAPDRQAVTDAQNKVDRLLGQDPVGNRSLLSEGLYFLDVPPLRVYFEVDLDAQHVEVTWVKELP